MAATRASMVRRAIAEQLRADGFKRCSACDAIKALRNFIASRSCWDGLDPRCRACTATRDAAKRERRRNLWSSTGSDPYADSSLKRCGDCKDYLPRTLFPRNQTCADGLAWNCCACAVSRSSQYRDLHRVVWSSAGTDRYADPSLKRCGACEQDRPRADFSPNDAAYDGLFGYCRGCSAAHNSTRRARILNQFVEHVDRSIAWDLAGGICYLCSLPCNPSRWDLDHVDPIVNGGEHSYFNTAPTHPSCNYSKGGTPWPDVAFDPAS